MEEIDDISGNGIGIAMNIPRSDIYSPFHWEMNLSEMGMFLFKWGWALNVKPPPYIIDEETWQLMNKINKREIPIPEIDPQEVKQVSSLEEIFKEIMKRNQ